MKGIVFGLLLASATVFGAETNAVKVFHPNYVPTANLRVVDGQLYDIIRSTKWQFVRCKYKNQFGEFAVFQKINRVKIGERPHEQSLSSMGLFTGPVALPPDYGIYADQDGEFILVKNASETNLVIGQEFSLNVMRVGQTNYNSGIVPIYDCGTVYMPTPEQMAAAKKADEEAEAKSELAKKVAAERANERALKANQDAAAKGDAYGLLRMGERYRDGDGVEKDLAKAREYLQRAADAGSPTAKEELSRLKP